MKKVVIAICAVLAALCSLAAQPGGGMAMGQGGMPDFEPIIKAQVDTLTLLLNLDPKQSKKVRGLIENQMNDQINVVINVMMNSAGDGMGGGRPQMTDETRQMIKEETEKLDARYEKKYAKVLTPEQMTEWKTYKINEVERRKREMEARRANGEGGRGGMGGMMPF